MGRRIRSLPGVDRTEFDGKPVGLQRHGDHYFDRHLFAVHLFHSAENGLKRITNTLGSADTQLQERTQRRIPSDITGLPHDPFGDLNLLLGYVIAIIAIAMLAYTLPSL